MTSGGNNFNDFPEIVPTREMTTKIEKTSCFHVGGRGPISWMGSMQQHRQYPAESVTAASQRTAVVSLTAECSDGAAFFMNKLACHWLLHQLLHLPRTNTVYSAWSMTHICAGVWGCGRPRAAPAKSQAEQRTERRFISTLLQLNNLSERHLGRVTMQVNPFPDCLPILLSLSGFTF